MPTKIPKGNIHSPLECLPFQLWALLIELNHSLNDISSMKPKKAKNIEIHKKTHTQIVAT